MAICTLQAVDQGTMTLHPTLQLYTSGRNTLGDIAHFMDFNSWNFRPCTHLPGTFPTPTKSKPVAVLQTSPDQLRGYWGQNVTTSSPPQTLISPYIWKRFWNLRLPHGSRTIWWRILTHHVSTNQHLHYTMPVKHPTPLCTLCYSAKESTKHLFIECPLKYVFWLDALHLIQAPSSVTPEIAWHAISLLPQPNTSFCHIHLDRLGLILQIIWAIHWRCIIRAVPWNHHIAYEHLQSLVHRQPFLVDPIDDEPLDFVTGTIP